MNKVEDRGYYEFQTKKKKDFLLEKEAFRRIIQDIPIVPKYIVELFGGVGLFASLVPESWKSSTYLSYDHDPKCIEIINEKHPWIVTIIADSFQINMSDDVEFVSADFNSYTIGKHLNTKDERYFNLIERISKIKNIKYFQLTDSSISKLHLNGEGYAKKLKTNRNMNTICGYTKALSDFYWENYQFGLISVYYHSNAIYFLFEKNNRRERICLERVGIGQWAF